jgi:hypothetical protein
MLSSLLLISCSGQKALMKTFSKYQIPVGYLYDSEIADCDTLVRIFVKIPDEQVLGEDLSVTRIKSKILPFIFFNHVETSYAMQLGEMSIDRDYCDFFRESFTEESRRTGCYSLTDEPAGEDYTLEIVFDSCKTVSKYQETSTVIILIMSYSMYFQETGFPAQTSLSVSATLRKDDEVIFTKNYFIENTQPFLPVNNRNMDRMRLDFVTNMAESLSLGTKECVEQIIQDVNSMIAP